MINRAHVDTVKVLRGITRSGVTKEDVQRPRGRKRDRLQELLCSQELLSMPAADRAELVDLATPRDAAGLQMAQMLQPTGFYSLWRLPDYKYKTSWGRKKAPLALRAAHVAPLPAIEPARPPPGSSRAIIEHALYRG